MEVGGRKLTWQVRTHSPALYSVSRYSVRRMKSRNFVFHFSLEKAYFGKLRHLANVVAQTALATVGLSHCCRSLSNVYF